MNSRIVVGICGGIAAYKTASLISKLVQSGEKVSVVLTDAAQSFVGPATFAALCNEQPFSSSFDPRSALGPHIELASDCKLLVIAPTTAHMLSACASGLASCLLSTLYLNVECPVLMAPAMSTPMWEKPAVQRNVDQLRSDGVHFVGPEEGWLSCRRKGIGRMSEPETIHVHCRRLLVP
ncbi:MAG: phosphopantothenoylcysteine decarboxylase [Planctomycetota bacterium]|nr:phosphopantothenoylcysteine decarboxylase [Planctomycetota bacterium]